MTGRYHRPEMTNDWTDTVFFAVCTPVESKPVTDVRHHPSPRAREFKALHGPDMKFLEVIFDFYLTLFNKCHFDFDKTSHPPPYLQIITAIGLKFVKDYFVVTSSIHNFHSVVYTSNVWFDCNYRRNN